VADALGIDLSSAPERTIEINTLLPCKDPATNRRTAFGYRISKLEIDASDGSHSYVVENPLIFVVPTNQCTDLQPPISPDIVFGGSADVNLGTDLFQTTQVLFDGPGNRLGMFTGVLNNAALLDFDPGLKKR
jgi:hypothetical protein